ncbi:hypothetical protein EST92_08050 [Streptomyces sp. TM32]|uniref:hypothetical protein n=1 Tax=Streptomyces sp. TM32 TaxID=1652669 RepID=UPI0010115324|nr:hypothetical protein [Streptomyces sp. TM32]RXS85435.1 hypothetical protein EST92_08050 [Streptomyces sp. TM32]
MFQAPPIRTATVAGALLLTAGLAWLPARDAALGPRPHCTGRRLASWPPDVRHTADFARYGNDSSRLDDPGPAGRTRRDDGPDAP